MNYHNKNTYPIICIFLITIFYYFEPIFIGKIAVHGDMIQHALAMVDLQNKIINGEAGKLWTSQLYGGHPIYAESQMGFYNPINYMLSALFDPITAKNLNHFICKLILLYGMFYYSKSYGLNNIISLFTALAVGFSTLFISYQSNITTDATVAWAPWALLFYTSFIKTANPIKALYLALTITLMVISGYPHFVHGLILYLLAFSIPFFVVWIKSKNFVHMSLIIKYIVISAIICILISSIQWIPLAELAALSHRSDGVATLITIPAMAIIRGLIYGQSEDWAMHGLSSLLVLYISLFSIMKINLSIAGHILGISVLLFLSIGDDLPAFLTIKELGIIPGLDMFRGTYPYLTYVVIGISILSGFGLKNLSEFREKHNTNITAITISLILTITFIVATYFPIKNYLQTILLATFILAISFLTTIKSYKYIPWSSIILILIEIYFIRTGHINYYSPNVLNNDSPVLKTLTEEEGYSRYKVYSYLKYGNYAFVPSDSNRLNFLAGRLNAGLLPSYNMHHSIASIEGNLALPLARRQHLESILRDEIQSTDSLGNRFIDVLAIKYISADDISLTEKNYKMRSQMKNTKYLLWKI